MTIGRTIHPHEKEIVPEGKRLRMKDWLKSRIGDPRYPGLVWLDEDKQIFRIPWKHAALHGWDQESDGALFRDWAEHTGACVRKSHPKQLKATFRCALHSLPDVHEERTQAKKRGDDACRVYRFESSFSSPRRRHIRIRNHKEKARKKHALKIAHECYKRNREISLSPCHNFSSWGKGNQQAMFPIPREQNYNLTSFSLQETEFSHDHIFPRVKRQSDPPLPHGLPVLSQGRPKAGSMESPFFIANRLVSMRQQVNIPEVSVSCLSKHPLVGEKEIPLQTTTNNDREEISPPALPCEEMSTSHFDGQTTPPIYSSYSLPQSLSTSTSFLSAEYASGFMSSKPITNHADSITHEIGPPCGSTRENSFTDLENICEYQYLEDNFAENWNSVTTLGPTELSSEMPQDTASSRYRSFKGNQPTSSQICEAYGQPCTIEQTLPNEKTSNASPEKFSSEQCENMPPWMPSYRGGTSVADWMPTLQHEPQLPAACTLLPTLNSPNTKWIPSDQQERSIRSSNFNSLPQCNDYFELSFNNESAFRESKALPLDLNSVHFGV